MATKNFTIKNDEWTLIANAEDNFAAGPSVRMTDIEYIATDDTSTPTLVGHRLKIDEQMSRVGISDDGYVWAKISGFIEETVLPVSGSSVGD